MHYPLLTMSIKNAKLDDVALLPPDRNLDLTLNEVGLENVQMQVRFDGQRLPARGYASVSLVDRKSRGIHMSRLFKVLTGFSERDLSWAWLNEGLAQMLVSHQGLSDSAHLAVNFEMPILRPALLSQERGWRTYPVEYRLSSVRGKFVANLKVRVLYSSTCPCSASLSRQALQDKFTEDFSTATVARDRIFDWLNSAASTVAVPHSQRSEAVCEFSFTPGHAPESALPLIDEMERALGTPVQAAVKREDEQEFARLNAQNLMFCEDAARKLKAALLKKTDLADFRIEVRHFESLHAHDVVAKVSKFDGV